MPTFWPVVVGVRDIDIPVAIEGYAGRVVKLLVVGALASEHPDQLSSSGEDLDAVVVEIGDINMSLLIDSNPSGGVKLSQCGSGFSPTGYVAVAWTLSRLFPPVATGNHCRDQCAERQRVRSVSSRMRHLA